LTAVLGVVVYFLNNGHPGELQTDTYSVKLGNAKLVRSDPLSVSLSEVNLSRVFSSSRSLALDSRPFLSSTYFVQSFHKAATFTLAPLDFRMLLIIDHDGINDPCADCQSKRSDCERPRGIQQNEPEHWKVNHVRLLGLM
jgi:hypothetical protein